MDGREISFSCYADAAPDFYITRVSAPCTAQQLHYHDYFQIYYISRGRVVHHCGGGSQPLWKGDAFLIPPLVPHRIELDDDAAFYSLSFYLSFFGESFASTAAGEFLRRLAQSGPETLRPRLTLAPERAGSAETICEMAMQEFAAREPYYRSVMQGFFCAMVSLLARAGEMGPAGETALRRSEEDRRAILMLLESLRDDCAQTLTLETASRRCLMSRAQFCRVFSQITGDTFKKYLHRLRAQRAAALIRETALPLSEIADRCGYDDFSSFYRNFVRITGVSPSAYRSAASGASGAFHRESGGDTPPAHR